MRKFFLVVALFNSTLSFAANHLLPKINFEYGYLLDAKICSPDPAHPITNEMIAELTNRQDEFKSNWHIFGKPLLKSTIDVLNRPLHHELTADYILCGTYSTSYPFLINMRKFLSSSTEKYPKEYFVFITYHLFLFHYIIENYPNLFENSVLLKKYQNETVRVRNHLFPHAIMLNIYQKLGREIELQSLITASSDKDAEEARSWQIVKDIEGYQSFINELKNQSALSRSQLNEANIHNALIKIPNDQSEVM